MSKHEMMREYLSTHGAFTIKDVLRVTRCNNPYRVIEHLKRAMKKPLLHHDIKKKNTWFRAYFVSYAAWLDVVIRTNWHVAPRRAR